MLLSFSFVNVVLKCLKQFAAMGCNAWDVCEAKSPSPTQMFMWVLLFIGLHDHDHLGSIKGVNKVK